MGIKGTKVCRRRRSKVRTVLCWSVGKVDVCVCRCYSVSSVIHSLHLEDTQANAPIQPHVRQAPVQCNHVTGHQIELVNLKELLHFLLVVLGDVHCLAHLPWTLMAPRYHRCNITEAKQKNILREIKPIIKGGEK